MRLGAITLFSLAVPLSLVAACDEALDVAANANGPGDANVEVNVDASPVDSAAAPDAGTSVSKTVDSAGATLELDTLRLTIPPGAIEEPQVVTLRLNERGSDVPSAPYSKRYDIQPQELTLKVNATLELEQSGNPRYPVLVVHAPETAVTLIAGDVEEGEFRAKLAHFGSVYLADAAELASEEEFATNEIVIELVGQGADTLDASASPSPDGSSVESSGATIELIVDANVPDAGTPNDANAMDANAMDAAGDARVALPLEPGLVSPQGYLTSDTGPFASVDFAYFYLEDFEDHELNQPGVSASTFQLSSSFGTSLVDSVDGDDGNPADNQCVKLDDSCDALWASGTVTFTFNSDELGGYPTHAGAVWTDGEGLVGFEAFGLEGEVIYALEPFSEPGFPGVGVTSDTAEDRFFGVYSPAGVTAIRLYNTSGGVEVDHLQYGRER